MEFSRAKKVSFAYVYSMWIEYWKLELWIPIICWLKTDFCFFLPETIKSNSVVEKREKEKDIKMADNGERMNDDDFNSMTEIVLQAHGIGGQLVARTPNIARLVGTSTEALSQGLL